MSGAPDDVKLTTGPQEETNARLDALRDGSDPVAGPGEAKAGARSDVNGDVMGCLAGDLPSGRRLLPGGRIFETDRLVVEHCVGPLGLASLVVKPKRHVTPSPSSRPPSRPSSARSFAWQQMSPTRPSRPSRRSLPLVARRRGAGTPALRRPAGHAGGAYPAGRARSPAAEPAVPEERGSRSRGGRAGRGARERPVPRWRRRQVLGSKGSRTVEARRVGTRQGIRSDRCRPGGRPLSRLGNLLGIYCGGLGQRAAEAPHECPGQGALDAREGTPWKVATGFLNHVS